MKKLVALCCLLTMLWLPLFSALAYNDDDFAVVDDEDILPPDLPMYQAEALLRGMTLRQKIYQLFIVCPEDLSGTDPATAVPAGMAETLKTYPVGGIVFFGKNLVSPEQTTNMLAEYQRCAGEAAMPGLFFAVDEEGGTVARVAHNLGGTKFDSAWAIGARGDVNEAYQMGQTLAKDLKSFGFNLNFAPVADLTTDPKQTEIGTRSFGSGSAAVSELVSALVRGMQENGLVATLKHFPGHGGVTGNSHLKKTSITRTAAEMRAYEWLPFQAGISQGAEMVMLSHLIAKDIDSASPASLSYAVVTGILRNELGFQGVIITDALRMQAITDNYKTSTAAVSALQAGVDVLLLSPDFVAAANAIEKAVQDGKLTEERIDESVKRILYVKIRYGLILGW